MACEFLCSLVLAAIVLPENPTDVERSAADELRDAVVRMNGVELRVVSEASAPHERNFYIGATHRAKPLSSSSTTTNVCRIFRLRRMCASMYVGSPSLPEQSQSLRVPPVSFL